MRRTARSPYVPAPRLEPEERAPADPLGHEVEGLIYSFDAPPRRHGRKSVVSVRLEGADAGPPLVDRADLFSFRSRRAFALIRAGVSVLAVQALLGHERLATTACYLRLEQDDLRRAVDLLEAGPRTVTRRRRADWAQCRP